uniref:Pentacotripeptide-repeat region of PRORP domain-containing protein n=2 Tax=Aegilops tauschii subsp. strangulata TaxID=200361 RepID=A0A453LVN2_AEGTS
VKYGGSARAPPQQCQRVEVGDSRMAGFRLTGLEARKVFVRMLSSGTGGSDAAVDAFDPAKRLCKLIISCRQASGLEIELDHSDLRVTPDVAERVLERLDNAGMLAYRFFEWARKQRRGGCAHTVRSFHTVVASLAKIRQYQLMWDVVAIMRRQGVVNVETFGIIMRKYARAQKVDEAVYTFNVMEKYGVVPNLAAFNSLLCALCKSKNVRKAQEIFEQMNGRFSPDAKTYSILLEGWGRAPNLPKMREVYSEMLEAGCQPDIVTYGIMVDSLCKTGRVEEAVFVVQDMSSRGCQPTTFIYSVLVHTYGVEMRIEDAVATFLDMQKDGIVPDVVVYNALVTAFCKVKKFDNAFRVMDDMEGHGITPNSRTWNIILNKMISLGKDEEAYRVFRRMIKRCQPDSDTYTMMIKMFCENDRLEMALKVWKYMRLKQFLPSMHTFSVLINGLCDKGEVSQACVLLEDMIEKGIRPPGSTFGKLRQLLLKEGRKDVLEFLVDKMKILIQEPLFD